MVNQTGIISKTAKSAEVSNRGETLKDVVISMQAQFERALPKVITPERFTRIALTALSSNPALMGCEKRSFLGALMNSAQLGLEPNTPLGQAYLIPFKNKKKEIVECQFQIGYKGLLDLAYRSGEFASIYAQTVYEKDEFEYEYGLEMKLKHKPSMKDRGEPICYYAVFKLKNGGSSFVVMSKDDMVRYGMKYSKTYNAGPWQTDFDSMAKKTVLKQLLKYAPVRSDYLTEAEVMDNSKSIYENVSGEVIQESVIVDEETGEILENEGE